MANAVYKINLPLKVKNKGAIVIKYHKNTTVFLLDVIFYLLFNLLYVKYSKRIINILIFFC